jgi:hypothetical protein
VVITGNHRGVSTLTEERSQAAPSGHARPAPDGERARQRSRPSPEALKQAAEWAAGIPFASWRYVARDVEIRREQSDCPWPLEGFPDGETPAPGDPATLRPAADGYGPAYRRLYRVCVDDPLLSAEELMAVMHNDPSVACPVEVARFEKTRGRPGQIEPGDEFRVRLPGPWNGPVRVIDVGEHSFRLATLQGHMEAGEIEFRASPMPDGRLRFEIESWARSGDRVFDLLYDHLGVSRELQLNMWAHFLERVAQISGGVVRDAIEVYTERCCEHPFE